MRTVIKGRLGNKPELRNVETAKGEKFQAVNFTLYVTDPTKKNDEGFFSSVPFQMSAYNERAVAISMMEPGDWVTGVADLRSRSVPKEKGSEEKITVPIWNMTKIDKNNELANQQTRLMTAYVRGEIGSLDIGLAGEFSAAKEAKDSESGETMEKETELPFEDYQEETPFEDSLGHQPEN